MATLSRDDILKLAKLSRLNLSEKEVEHYQQEIKAVLSYVEKLQDAELDNVKPTNQVTGLVNVMRQDKALNYGADTQQLLKNAPQTDGNYIKVRRVL